MFTSPTFLNDVKEGCTFHRNQHHFEVSGAACPSLVNMHILSSPLSPLNRSFPCGCRVSSFLTPASCCVLSTGAKAVNAAFGGEGRAERWTRTMSVGLILGSYLSPRLWLIFMFLVFMMTSFQCLKL